MVFFFLFCFFVLIFNNNKVRKRENKSSSSSSHTKNNYIDSEFIYARAKKQKQNPDDDHCHKWMKRSATNGQRLVRLTEMAQNMVEMAGHTYA